MHNGIRILRPMEKFMGRSRLPGEIIPGSQLKDVSYAAIQANKDLGNIGYLGENGESLESGTIEDLTKRIDGLEENQETIQSKLDGLIDRMSQPETTAKDILDSTSAPRRRGRPSGSKNKPN